MIKRWLFIVLSASQGLMAQSLSAEDPAIFQVEDFMVLVARNHPVARAASLWEQKSTAQLGAARGAWDPVVSGAWKEKEYLETPYYNLFSAELDVPTPLGIQLYATVNEARGNYVNPQNYFTEDGVVQLGLDIPLLSGLLYDEQRGAVKIAKTLAGLNKAERDLVLNSLFYEAYSSYVQWTTDYNRLQLLDTVVQIAEDRRDFVLRSFERGARPAIDTLEATIAYRNRLVARQEALISYIETYAKFQSFLWDSVGNPLYLTDEVQPDDPSRIENVVLLLGALNANIENHPELRNLDALLEINRIERRVKLEKVKPKLDVSASLLNSVNGFAQNDYWSVYTPDNYFVGIKWSTPLWLRTSRNELKLNNVERQELEWKRINQRQKLLLNIAALERQIESRADQWGTTQKITQEYEQLLRAEQRIFFQGGSSLFLLNSRESAYLSAGLKMWDNFSKYIKTYLEWQNERGTLFLTAP